MNVPKLISPAPNIFEESSTTPAIRDAWAAHRPLYEIALTSSFPEFSRHNCIYV